MSTRRQPSNGLALLVRPERIEAAWWRAWRDIRCEHARRKLFDHHRKLADAIAWAHHVRRTRAAGELAEARQLAYEALLQSIERFDPERSVPFAGFARRRIAGHIINGFASFSEAGAQHAYARRVERDRLRSLASAQGDASNPLATLSELAAMLALGFIMEDREALDPESIPSNEPNAYQNLAWRELHERLAQAMTRLEEREAYVLDQHYNHAVEFVQIARLLGVSKGRISQIHRAALQRLRKMLGEIGSDMNP